MDENTVHRDCELRPTPSVLTALVGDEAVLLAQTEGLYYGLNEVSARAWQLIERGARFDDVRRALQAEYDVDETRLTHDLDALIRRWLDLGLVVSHQANQQCPSATSSQ